MLEAEDRLQPNGQAVDITAFIAECHAHRNQPLARTVGAINNFTQCLASPLVSARGAVEATICFVLPIDMPEAKRRSLEARQIEAASEISIAAHR